MKRTNTMSRLLQLSLLVLWPVAAGAADRTTYFVNDALGSPVAAMSEQGDVLWHESYAPYGERRVKSVDNPAKPAYTGKPEDVDTGLVYMGARMYDPETARFTGIDPQGFVAGNPQSYGRYVYANNAPYRYVDPNGESPLEWGFVVGDVASAGANIAAGNIAGATWDIVNVVLDAQPVPGLSEASHIAKVAKATEKAGDAARGAGDTVDVYRVFGGDARAHGFSWTTKDPRSVGDFRDTAGLPSGGASGATNTADFLVKGKINTGDIIDSRAALPLDGNKGGLPELIIDPKNVAITDFSVLKP